MDDRSRERLMVANAVLKALRTRDFRSTVQETTQGEHVIIPALEDDPVGQFFDEFRIADGPLYIATLKDAEIRVLSVIPAHVPRHAMPMTDECPFYAETHLGMIITYLEMHRTPVTFYEAPKSMTVELVDGDLLAVPS